MLNKTFTGGQGDDPSNRRKRVEPSVLICLISTFVGLAAGGNAMSAMGDDPISPRDSLFVPKAEYAKVVRQALDGSAEAALRLESQYAMTAHYTEAIFWATIAAENGSQVGAYNLASTLAKSPHANQRRRARYWLKKLIAVGGEMGKDAQSLLAELDEDEKKGTKKTYVFPERYPKW